MNRINHEMIVLAREARGLTQGELAEKLSVTQGKISKIEQGILKISDETLDDLSRTLNFPRRFFLQQRTRHFPGSYYHRKRKSCSQTLLKKNDALLNILLFSIQELLKSVEIDTHIQTLYCDPEEYSSPEEIARIVRHAFRVPPGPISNLTKIVEDAGAIVVHYDFETPKIDGISFYFAGFPPVVFLNKYLPGDRLRYSLAHELGHIVMHHPSGKPRPEEEDEANRFASEFLIPEQAVRAHLSNLSLEKLAALKRYWKVSMAALLQRATNMRKITERQARYLWMQMGKAGFRLKEPPELAIPQEKPGLVNELLQIHKK